MFLVNSRLSPLTATPSRHVGVSPTHAAGAPLLPKLRGQFAEFLNGGSLVHLGVLTPAHQCRYAVRATRGSIAARGFSRRPAHGVTSTGVTAGSRSGSPFVVGSGFAWTPDSPDQPTLSIRSADAGYRVPPFAPHALAQDSPPAGHRLRPPCERPRLRTRLTLGRLPLPRNP